MISGDRYPHCEEHRYLYLSYVHTPGQFNLNHVLNYRRQKKLRQRQKWRLISDSENQSFPFQGSDFVNDFWMTTREGF